MNLPPDIQSAIVAARATIRFGYPWWLRPFMLRDVAGVTLGRRIYLAAEVAERQADRVLRHELAHVRQINRVGLVRFYWAYVTEYVRNRLAGMSSAEAYRNISFEIEAVAAEDV